MVDYNYINLKVDDEQTKQQHSERITMLEVQVREFRDSNEQLIKDKFVNLIYFKAFSKCRYNFN
jgi:hypothetical protein